MYDVELLSRKVRRMHYKIESAKETSLPFVKHKKEVVLSGIFVCFVMGPSAIVGHSAFIDWVKENDIELNNYLLAVICCLVVYLTLVFLGHFVFLYVDKKRIKNMCVIKNQLEEQLQEAKEFWATRQ